MRRLSFIALFLAVAAALAGQTPRLVVPVGHAGAVNAVAFSSDNRFVLTGSWDQTAKLWDLSGRMIRTFYIGASVSSVAFSPDGKSILTGSGNHIAKLWDLSGHIIKDFDGHEGAITSVAFSPDGKSILTGSEDHIAKLWDLSGHTIQDFKGHKGAITSVAFSPDGKSIVTGSEDKKAILWNRAGKIIQEFIGHQSGVYSVAISPDGKFVLTGGKGGMDTARLWDLSGNSIKEFSSPEKDYFEPVKVDFSPDGLSIVSTGGGLYAYRWDLSGKIVSEFKGHINATSSVIFSSDGKYVLTGSADYTAKLWDLSGREIQDFSGHTNMVCSMDVSPKGNYILTGTEVGTVKLWDLRESKVYTYKVGGDFVPAVYFVSDTKYLFGGSKLMELNGQIIAEQVPVTTNPKDGSVFMQLKDKDLKAEKSEKPWGRFIEDTTARFFKKAVYVSSLALSTDNNYFLAADGYQPRLYDLSGRLIRAFQGQHTLKISAACFSPGFPKDSISDRFTWTGSWDNTVKLWNTSTGEELATLIALDSTDWVVTTPSGLFDASPGAMNLMYYVQGLEVIDLEQLKDRYYEPDLLARIMGLAEGELRRIQGLESQELALCPLLLEATVVGEKIRVRLQNRDGGIGAAVVLLDGDIELIPDANPQRLESFEIDLAPYSSYFIDNQANQLSLIFYTRDGWPPSQPYMVDYTPGGVKSKGDPGAPAPSPLTTPGSKSDLANTLYALVVGTSRYAGAELNLRFPDKDAAAYKEMLELSGSALFGARMNIKLLSTAVGGTQPTKAAIQSALAEFAARAEPKDVLLVYLSGHGTSWPANSPAGQFYYLTVDNSSFDFDNAGNRRHAISQDSLQAWIRAVKARKRILILDACNSGEVVRQIDIGAKGGNLNSDQRRALVRMKDRAGFFVLAGSAADKSSYEDPRFGHGLLTYSLLRNTPKVAAGDKNHYVDVGRLFMEVREDVPKLAGEVNKVQEPKLIGMEDFSIGIIKDSTAVKLPSVKKIITKSSFRNLRQSDPLKITDAVNEQLEQMLADPAQHFAFWPVDKAAGEYHTLNGSYEVSGTAVKVTAWLYRYKGDTETELKTFIVSGVSNQVNRLVDELMEQFAEYLEGMQ